MFELRLEHISKKFTHKTVLKNVNVSFNAGEIHSLLGENGAGKSTLAAIIAGFIKPDTGDFFYGEKEIRINSVRLAIQNGIVMVHQQPRIADELSIWQNIVLGAEKRRPFGILDRSAEFVRIAKISRDWGIDLRLTDRIGQLPASDRFYVALLAALYQNPKLLIIDEPSAVLDPHQRRFFYKALSTATLNGLSVLLITHNIEEAVKYSDKISVLNHGVLQKTFSEKTKRLSAGAIQRLMFEKEISDKKNTVFLPQQRKGKTALRVRDLTVRAKNGVNLTGIYLQAHLGDITVIAAKNGGVLKTLEDILTGMYENPYFGSISLRGKPLVRVTPAVLRAAGTALVPSNKIWRASNPHISVYDMLTCLRDHDRSFAKRLVDSEDVLISLEESAQHLSGGMLQRLVLAREFAQKPKLVILAEPTAGLDRKAELRLWESLRMAADSGCAIVVLTSDVAGIETFMDKLYQIEDGTVKAAKNEK